MAEPGLILDARRGVLRYAFLCLVALAGLGVLALFGADLVLGLNPNVPDRDLSLPERFAIAGLLILIDGALIGGIVLLGARYLVSLRISGTEIEMVTIMPWGLRHLRKPASQVTLGAHYAPVVTGRQHVDAPWQTLRLAGYRVPFIIDLQAAHYDEQALRLFLSRAGAQEEKNTPK